MKKVIVSKPNNSSLNAQLISLYNTFKNVQDSEKLEFDLCKLEWVHPFLILPISSYINFTKSKIDFTDCPVKRYLDIVNFPMGVDSVSDFEKASAIHRSYIPISLLKRDAVTDREKLETIFLSMLYKVIDVSIEGVRNGIYYPITELVNNIFEHSKQKSGFVFGQYYPNKEYLDICIVDNGIGLKGSYKEGKEIDLTDEQAIAEAMSGNSVKSNKERGYGLWTSKKVICEGLDGSFILLSGSSAIVSSKSGDKIIELPDFNWQGVIIGYRIPKPTKPFDISQFVE